MYCGLQTTQYLLLFKVSRSTSLAVFYSNFDLDARREAQRNLMGLLLCLSSIHRCYAILKIDAAIAKEDKKIHRYLFFLIAAVVFVASIFNF